MKRSTRARRAAALAAVLCTSGGLVLAGSAQASASTTGTLSIVAGTGTAGTPTPGTATSSSLYYPTGVAVDPTTGDLYIADTSFNVIAQVTPPLSPQTITFTSTPPASASVGGTYTLAATGGGSGNPVTFSIDASSTSGACSIAGSTVSFTGTGTCVIDANQAGSTSYAAASQAQEKLTVAAAVRGGVRPGLLARNNEPARDVHPGPGPGPGPGPAAEAPAEARAASGAPADEAAAPRAQEPHPRVVAAQLQAPGLCPGFGRGVLQPRPLRRPRGAHRRPPRRQRWHPVLAKGRVDLRAGQRERVELRVTPTGAHIFSHHFAKDVARHGHFRVTLTTRLFGVRPQNTATYLKP